MKKISEIINLRRAYSEVLHNEKQGEDFIPDSLNFIDTKKDMVAIIQKLEQDLDINNYRPQDLIKMDVPKDNFFLRPGARPVFEDLVIYHSLATYIGIKAEPKIPNNVYSTRFDNKGKLRNRSDQWMQFEKDFWDQYESGFSYVLKTDITAFFANIYVERLRTCILSVIGSTDETELITTILFNIVRTWANKENNKGFGIPQGIIASSILGNLFLYHVDATMNRIRTIRFLRYADDIRILGKVDVDLKIGLKTLISELRRCGLDLNEKKTKFLKKEEVEQEMRDPRRQDMDTIATLLNMPNESLIKSLAMPILHDLFERSFDSSNKFGDRHLRFCVKCFIRLRKIYDIQSEEIKSIGLKLIDKLQSAPGSTNIFSRFFKTFPRHEFKKELLKFLKSNNNIYDWQEMHILDSLLRFDSYKDVELNYFRRLAKDRDKHPAVRAKAILLMGCFGNEHDRYELITRFNEEKDYIIERSILIACQQHSTAERNEFFSTVKRTNSEHIQLLDFLKKQSEPIYFDDFAPPPVVAVDELS